MFAALRESVVGPSRQFAVTQQLGCFRSEADIQRAVRRFREEQQAQVARDAIDARTVRTVKVQGTGTLTANINAPPGTDVTLGGTGLFKKTEMNRQVQMTPAAPGTGMSGTPL